MSSGDYFSEQNLTERFDQLFPEYDNSNTKVFQKKDNKNKNRLRTGSRV